MSTADVELLLLVQAAAAAAKEKTHRAGGDWLAGPTLLGSGNATRQARRDHDVIGALASDCAGRRAMLADTARSLPIRAQARARGRGVLAVEAPVADACMQPIDGMELHVWLWRQALPTGWSRVDDGIDAQGNSICTDARTQHSIEGNSSFLCGFILAWSSSTVLPIRNLIPWLAGPPQIATQAARRATDALIPDLYLPDLNSGRSRWAGPRGPNRSGEPLESHLAGVQRGDQPMAQRMEARLEGALPRLEHLVRFFKSFGSKKHHHVLHWNRRGPEQGFPCQQEAGGSSPRFPQGRKCSQRNSSAGPSGQQQQQQQQLAQDRLAGRDTQGPAADADLTGLCVLD
ncbi:unnamed protein product [Phytophthora fragariaefolia]|uniref:Unnamed protein product n=1 Tax=Phytophthora fragariaefolia TaxID=1490495 RepID=A0A9W6X637_9STRA|nr:unnamed protein product [Phytophthora fragariaefolia]